ncbi:hypothetical protein XELAEV_18006486mg [Xenopus laevis]|uniref:Uncharacterized protein n=1 Tax=Xenopus laevis TaxID=8355 RepID=A0A974E0M8_XENLA|nr:hypothetical protein XELAEV_18006486mg [Xenopus laevis]
MDVKVLLTGHFTANLFLKKINSTIKIIKIKTFLNSSFRDQLKKSINIGILLSYNWKALPYVMFLHKCNTQQGIHALLGAL